MTPDPVLTKEQRAELLLKLAQAAARLLDRMFTEAEAKQANGKKAA